MSAEELLSPLDEAVRALAEAVRAEAVQDFGALFEHWLALARAYEAAPTAVAGLCLDPVPSGASACGEALWELLARHAATAPHGGVRRAACFLLAACWASSPSLQRAVVAGRPGAAFGHARGTPAAGGSAPSFRWRGWWVALVPRAAHRNWEVRRAELQLDRKYDVKLRRQQRKAQPVLAGVPREALTLSSSSFSSSSSSSSLAAAAAGESGAAVAADAADETGGKAVDEASAVPWQPDDPADWFKARGGERGRHAGADPSNGSAA